MVGEKIEKEAIFPKEPLYKIINMDLLYNGEVIFEPKTWKELFKNFNFYVNLGYKPAIYVSKPEYIDENLWMELLNELSCIKIIKEEGFILYSIYYDKNKMNEDLKKVREYLSEYIMEEKIENRLIAFLKGLFKRKFYN